ncbi:MAG: Rne/Rng family ribonuclease [Acidobacteria bacterium]|nr:Rne/Rng family ribonuclease [Acidobacteriota bacterium]
MAKEMIVSCSSHERKVAILQDNQLEEIYFEREKEYSIAGSIYKGRVTRVLPGMQSAFVDIGLERDAFLYVSDFFEDTEEYDKVVSLVEEKVSKIEEVRAGEAGGVVVPLPSGESLTTVQREVTPSAGPPTSAREEKTPPRPEGPHHLPRRSRRRRSRGSGRGFPESKYARRFPSEGPREPEAASVSVPTILPGESLAKYKDRGVSPAGTPAEEKLEAMDAPSGAEAEPLGPGAIPVPAAESSSPPEGADSTILEVEESTTLSHEETAPLSPASQTMPPPAGFSEVQEPEGESLLTEKTLPVEAQTVWPKVSEQTSGITEESPAQEVAPGLFAEAIRDNFIMAETKEEEPAESNSGETEERVSFLEEDLTESEGVSTESQGAMEPMETEGAGTEAPGREERPPEESGMPQEAAVREKGRNPRYQRKARWLARREEKEARPDRRPQTREREVPKPLIADLLKEGQNIIVQVAKEALGKKGARITSHIALPGRYLVYMPTVDHIGISHKIASEPERLRLKRILRELVGGIPGGFIVRTAGEGRSLEDFRKDVLFLTKLWAEFRSQAEKLKAPALLHHDLDLIQRTLRDQLSEDFTAVWVDSEPEYEEIVDWVSKFQPSLVGRIKLYTKDVPLFEATGIQEELDKALKPKIWLKSGGYIVINQTEALVAIDINTGKFVGKSNRLEDTSVKTTVDAIQEIERQIRLRDLGVIIVNDFIDMDERKNRQKVMAALEEALKADRAPSKILSFNEFGLVTITRKRVRQSLERTLCDPCPYCNGSGFVKSVTTVCFELLSEARKMASQLEGKQITLRVNPEVGKALKARDNTILAEIEELTGKSVIVHNDPMLHVENFDFE